MKALVVYESMFGNTEQVAQAIAKGLSQHGEVQLVEVSGERRPQARLQDSRQAHELLRPGCQWPTARW